MSKNRAATLVSPGDSNWYLVSQKNLKAKDITVMTVKNELYVSSSILFPHVKFRFLFAFT